MEQQCGRKIELRLTKEQEQICIRSCAVARRAYNWKLAQQNADYEKAKQNTAEGSKVKCKLGTPIDWHREWVKHKHLAGNEWMLTVSKCCGQEALRDLGTAWKKFFATKGKYPQFHKYGVKDSFRVTGSVYIGHDFVQIPILGKVKLKEKDYIAIPKDAGKVPLSMATISRTADRWYVSFSYVTDIIPANESIEITDNDFDIVGVDLGIKDLAITSFGQTISNPASYKRYIRYLKRQQRSVSRKRKGGKNRKKAVQKLARIQQISELTLLTNVLPSLHVNWHRRYLLLRR